MHENILVFLSELLYSFSLLICPFQFAQQSLVILSECGKDRTKRGGTRKLLVRFDRGKNSRTQRHLQLGYDRNWQFSIIISHEQIVIIKSCLVSAYLMLGNTLTPRSLVAYFMALLVCLGSFIMGFSLVIISLLQREISFANSLTLNSDQDLYISLATTALPLGAILGSYLMKDMCNKWGECHALILIDLIAIFASLLQMITLEIGPLIFSRLLIGIFCGVNTGIVPMYLTSLAPPSLNGSLGTINQLLITVGIALAYYFNDGTLGGMIPELGLYQWQLMLGLPIVYAIARILYLLATNIDTLERHYARGQTDVLKRYLEMMYGENGEGALQSLVKMKSLDHWEISKAAKSIKKQNKQGKPKDQSPNFVLRLAVVLAISNQMSGINAILFYAKQLFFSVRSSSISPQNCVLYLGVFQVIITFISSLLIQQFGRRSLMLVGQFIVAGSLILGWIFVEFVAESQTIVIALIFGHIMGFSLSLGPISMVYVSQIMTNMSYIILLVWFLTFIVSLISQMMIATLGIGKVFLFYGIISTACFVYLNLYMVESKGKNRVDLVSEIEGRGVPPYVQEKRLGSVEASGLLEAEVNN